MTNQERIRAANSETLAQWIAAELTLRGEPAKQRKTIAGYVRVTLTNRNVIAEWTPDAARQRLARLSELPHGEATLGALLDAGLPAGKWRKQTGIDAT